MGYVCLLVYHLFVFNSFIIIFNLKRIYKKAFNLTVFKAGRNRLISGKIREAKYMLTKRNLTTGCNCLGF